MNRARTGISKREEAFCLEICKGETYTNAYLSSFPHSDPGDDPDKRKWLSNKASRLAAKPKIKQRIQELLKASGASDLASIGQAMSALNRIIAKAEAEGDCKAAVAGIRLQAQMLGGLDQRLVIAEEISSDSPLLQRLAKGNPELANQLKALLPAEGFKTIQ